VRIRKWVGFRQGRYGPVAPRCAESGKVSSERAFARPELRIAPADSSVNTGATYRERLGASASESHSRAELGFAAGVHGHGDGSELGLVHKAIGRPVVGVVERVEHLRADLHAK